MDDISADVSVACILFNTSYPLILDVAAYTEQIVISDICAEISSFLLFEIYAVCFHKQATKT